MLQSITRFDDLPRLGQALGYEPVWRELPAGALTGAGGAAVAGWRAGLELYASTGEERGAVRAARALHAGGTPAVVVVLNERTRRLGIAAADAGPLIISLDAPDPLGLARLDRTRVAGAEAPLAAVFRIAEALSGRGVDQRFFGGFRRTLAQGCAALPGHIPAADRHALALLQLTRIHFLYFVESKGWLAGRRRFLREEVDHCLARRHSLHRQLLAPLFFGTLNRPAADRSALARRFGDLPFLNGGLFEPHPLEQRWRVHLPTPVLRNAFDDLFERFHFTVATSTGEAIAPDMLGRVFEGVMEPAERRGSGTFYTPASLVDALVTEAIGVWVGSRLRVGASEAERRVRDPDAATRGVLRDVRLLDPAAGSGAFLLGALRLLGAPGDDAGRAARFRRVLGRNLYGVDRNAAAVRLAELRLWLEVIGADPGTRPADVRPLPNLDALLRQGDSLVEPVAALPPARHLAAELGRLRRTLIGACGAVKRRVLAEFRRTELAIARDGLERRLAVLEASIADLVRIARDPTLFEDRRGLDRAERRALAGLRVQQREVRAARRHLLRTGSVPWFQFATHFAEVVARGGFDVIVGNPPWVRSEALEPALRRHLAERFRWFRGVRCGSRGYAHLPDLSVAFLERAVELVAPGGVVGFLLPSKIATTGYASAARTALGRHATLHVAADLAADPRARFDATVYPYALVASPGSPPDEHPVRLGLGSAAPARPQREFVAGPWPLHRHHGGALIERIRSAHPALGERCSCQLGVKTGLNQAFLDPPGPVEPALMRWAVRGRDVRAFTVRPVRRLLWPCDDRGYPLDALPREAARHLAPFLPALSRRADHHAGRPWALFRTGPASARYRVIWPDLARRLEAAALLGAGSRDLIPLNSCYVIAAGSPGTARALEAWLNCTWCRALARHDADTASGGFHRFNARVIAALPLPPAVLDEPWLPPGPRHAAGPPLPQDELDDRTARLLRLTSPERVALAELAHDGASAGR